MKIIDGTNVVTLDYAAGFVYVDEEVDYVLTEEGRLTPSTGEYPFVYEYFLKDHLGNVRVSFSDYDNDGEVEILQENHYYPFGLTFGGLDYVSSISSENLLQYNGKENQEGHNLAWVDYGFRMYDPQIGRWHVIDALAQSYSSTSPYAYVRNNPINRIDIMGLSDEDRSGGIEFPSGGEIGRTVYGSDNNSANNMWNDLTSSVAYSSEEEYQDWKDKRMTGGTNLSYSKWMALNHSTSTSGPTNEAARMFENLMNGYTIWEIEWQGQITFISTLGNTLSSPTMDENGALIFHDEGAGGYGGEVNLVEDREIIMGYSDGGYPLVISSGSTLCGGEVPIPGLGALKSPKLIKAAIKAWKSNKKGFANLLREVNKGNLNPGTGTKNLKDGINYLRHRDGARIFFRNTDNGIEIIGYSNKQNESKVIMEILKLF